MSGPFLEACYAALAGADLHHICITSANQQAVTRLPACVVSAMTTISDFAFCTAACHVKVMSQHEFTELNLLSVESQLPPRPPPPLGL